MHKKTSDQLYVALWLCPNSVYLFIQLLKLTYVHSNVPLTFLSMFLGWEKQLKLG